MNRKAIAGGSAALVVLAGGAVMANALGGGSEDERANTAAVQVLRDEGAVNEELLSWFEAHISEESGVNVHALDEDTSSLEQAPSSGSSGADNGNTQSDDPSVTTDSDQLLDALNDATDAANIAMAEWMLVEPSFADAANGQERTSIVAQFVSDNEAMLLEVKEAFDLFDRLLAEAGE